MVERDSIALVMTTLLGAQRQVLHILIHANNVYNNIHDVTYIQFLIVPESRSSRRGFTLTSRDQCV